MTSRILLQLDADPHPSSFDAVVAIDAGVDQLLRYGGVTPETLTSIVHGMMFTRGGDQLRHSAIFVGGSDVAAAETLFAAVQQTFFGPLRLSVMLDANGCNTTAAAAVVAAAKHVTLEKSVACVLGGTGPVGRRVAELLAAAGAEVRLSSRSRERGQAACVAIQNKSVRGTLAPVVISRNDQSATLAAIQDAAIVIACGAAGTELVDAATLSAASSVRVAIDLNAVPPTGIGGVDVTDKAKPLGETIVYGAIGVGGFKMKIHRAAIESLFDATDRVLDAREIYAIAQRLAN